jgi:selenocysteine-specific elongation factor
MFVIGTAGHVDHGKSSLVLALTGIDPDRLPEEKKREMTIDLGFAWLSFPDGTEAGIVDVPGHERFVKNMIAGVGGIDAVIFVVAADDGWMPQSEEHLEILKLLNIRQGIVVISKIDLVKEDWLNLVVEDVKEKLKGTFLENAPLVQTSTTKKTGIEKLHSEIEKMIKKIQPQRDLGKPRIYIDRVFTIAGRGTVITGTLINGSFSLGEEVKILPQEETARIRELQSHKKKREKSEPGTRVALNLAGVEKTLVSRGDVVVKKDQGITSTILDTSVNMISTQKFPLKHNSQVLFIIGTTEVLAKAILLDGTQLKPGESGFVQFRFSDPVVARVGDHFIIRLPSPAITVGGGKVLDIDAKRHKRKDKSLLNFLSQRESLNLSDLILSELNKKEFMLGEELLKESNFKSDEIQSILGQLEKENKLFKIDNLTLSSDLWNNMLNQISKLIGDEHKKHPFKIGIKISDLLSQIKFKQALVDKGIEYLLSSKKIKKKEAYLHFPEHQPQLTPEQKEIAKKIAARFNKTPSSPPIKEDFFEEKGFAEVIAFMLQNDEIVELKDGILYRKDDFDKIIKLVVELIRKNGPSTVSQIKDHLKTTRKYAVPILEKLDQLEITKREGDKRVLGPEAEKI